MNRREFTTLLGGAAAWPLAAGAQQSAIPIVGFLSARSSAATVDNVAAFRRGLTEQGYNEGQNVTVEYRWAEGHFDRLAELAADLIRRRAVIIVASGISSALGVRKASATIPLVFLAGDDPVKFGLVQSLNRPGGAATGVAWLTSELFTKRLEIVRQLVPADQLIGVLVNPASPELEPQLKQIETAAQSLNQAIDFAKTGSDTELNNAFANLAEHRAAALMVSNDPFFNSVRERIIALAAQYRIPTIYDRSEYITAGGLISYGTSYSAAYRQLGIYTAKILKGTAPADLPIEQATKFEMLINLKTAKTLGIEIPPRLLALADKVIE